jgi:hypothetical protein
MVEGAQRPIGFAPGNEPTKAESRASESLRVKTVLVVMKK